MKRLTLVIVIAALAAAAAGGAVWWRRTHRLVTAAQNMPMADAATSPAAPTAAAPRGPVTIDPRRQQLIGVRTVAARRTRLTQAIRTSGSVRSSEARVTDVNVKLDGWIRDLFVDYTGAPVSRGQPLFTLYSPDLLAVENEYLLALKARDALQQSAIADAKDRAAQLVAAARQRLGLWDLPEDHLQALDERRQATSTVTFRAPVSGVVMEKTAVEGMRITAGQTLYRVADLSTVWVEADVFESDVPLVRVGQRATVTLDAYPGERFSGRVIYIYPYLDEQTRTNRVRYEFANPGGRLKPGMFANVELTAAGGTGIVVPLNALLDSGREQIVFVSQGDGYFEPRNVKAGRRLGDDVQIVEGIKEGDVVATGAAFFLDSESQLRAAVQGYEPAGSSGGAPPQASQLQIAFHTVPDPPRTGENQMEAIVKDAAGMPVDGADVAVQLFMPAMPTMNMPPMRSETKLAPAGGGAYRGPGQMMMAGQWQATVTVMRGGRRLGSSQTTVVAK